MRALVATLAVVWTLLLGAVALELYRIDRSLAWISAPVRGLAVSGSPASPAAASETREQRIDRKAREINATADETRDVLTRSLELQPPAKSAPALPSRR